VIRAKVDADHASISVTRRSRTGFLVWINSCLVYFLSKKQTSVEFFTIGSEFVAMEQCCEYLREWPLLHLWRQLLERLETFTEFC
jgi:hypothetical protein